MYVIMAVSQWQHGYALNVTAGVAGFSSAGNMASDLLYVMSVANILKVAALFVAANVAAASRAPVNN